MSPELVEYLPYIVGLLAFLAIAAGVAATGEDKAEKARKRLKLTKGEIKREALMASVFGKDASTADRLKILQEERARAKRASLSLRLIQAGMKSKPASFLAIMYAVAAVLGVATFVGSREPLAAAGVAGAVALLGPGFVLARKIKRRQQKFLELFPSALDVLIRGVRSGLPITEGMKVIAEEIPEPVGPEIYRVVAANQLGMSIDDALEQLNNRVPGPDVNFFRTVLAIQRQTGGNLAESLSNLSGILRERRKLKQKVAALSSEARMSAIIIGSLPFIVGTMVYLLRPEYIEVLFTDPTGQMMLGGGLVWMSFGVLTMRSMIRFDI